jgi:hypothetical protein
MYRRLITRPSLDKQHEITSKTKNFRKFPNSDFGDD